MPALVGCRGRLARVVSASAGPPPSTVGHGCTRRTWDAVCVAAGLRLHGLHRRFVFAVIARDCTDNAASTPICASSSPWRVHSCRRSDQLIERLSPPSTSPSTRLPPIEHRVAAASPLYAAAPPPLVRATGCQRVLPGVYAPVASRRCPDSRPAATPPPRVVASPHAVYFAVPALTSSASTPSASTSSASTPSASTPSAHGLRHTAGSSSPTSCTAAAPPPQVAAGLADHSRSRWARRPPQRPSRRPA